jgi:hypothetical protein
VRIFELIDAELADHDITRVADLPEVSRSGYYAWTDRMSSGPGPRAA